MTTTKGGRLRHVPMTARLAAALQTHRHLKSERVLCQGDGQPLTQKIVQDFVKRAARRAHLSTTQRYMHLSPAAIDSAIRSNPRRRCL